MSWCISSPWFLAFFNLKESILNEIIDRFAWYWNIVFLLGCPVVFDHNGALTCQLPAIVSDAKVRVLINSLMILMEVFLICNWFSVQTAVTYASEHVYPGPGKEAGAPTLILYAEIWTPEFAQAHRQLAQLAEEGKVRRSFLLFSATRRSGRQICANSWPTCRVGKVRRTFSAVLYMEIWTSEFAQAIRQPAQLAEEGKVRRSFLLFPSTWRSGRQSLRRRTGNWPSSQVRLLFSST